ncbi:sensor histidine kinase [Stackebrandtia nassauensis]|uniref:histidine kinase n=1 Tax=Stackebrandtia nassauensis (strain DSM 44728 / CIP 108903 / NRRL B-16338 / NBRC 102104 / LLR-40K-21) TaxID=446470 RepID=D3PV90_STANL|nr:sensor histidine kinase KdpD [Stackebrandtia nassauensis]ADD41143.1 Osmosensitive K channel His kinase sensor [Stackebrandtia nassauensis DSM 44728]
MKRGHLRIYLGAAPGVGKTYAALEEARRRVARGTDVVVGFVETHGRRSTAALLDGLEVLPRHSVGYRGTAFEEFDVDAVLRRRPEVAVVDELAHTNVPGSRNQKRWQDIDELLDAGINVISTVNIQHLESLNDVVTKITGVPQQETVPDEVVRRAEQVELADLTPEALRRRMTHGNVYPPEKIDAALSNYFRVGNLTALRELALLWLADKVEDQLSKYRSDKDIKDTWESKERVVVALSGDAEGDTLIRRAKRIAARSGGADLRAVYVASGDGLAGARNAKNLARQRLLVESMGGTFHQVIGDDIPTALLDFARGVNATQLVLGASRRGRFAQILSTGVGVTTTAKSGSIDVHLVTHDRVAKVKRPTSPAPLSRQRRITGFTATILGLPALVAALLPLRDDLNATSIMLIMLTAVMGIALTGGMWPAVLAAVGGFLLVNFFFLPPLYTFAIGDQEHLLALCVFVFVGFVGATVVNILAARTRQAGRASAEAQTLSILAGSVLRGEDALPALMNQMLDTFGLTSVTLLERRRDGVGPDERHDPADWTMVACAGTPCASPGEAETDIPIDDKLSLALKGRTLDAADRRIVEAFAMQAAVALKQERLAAEAATARPLAAADKMRTALLAAVSHDLRTPLASAKAAVAGLRGNGDMFSAADRDELLLTADESLDRLDRLVSNLLDMSRLQAGALGAHTIPIGLEEVVPTALDELGEAGREVRLDVAGDLPEVAADPGLLERIIVNVVGNALRHSPPGTPPLVKAGAHDDIVELRVIDHGPGVPDVDQEQLFTPFQRLGDRDNASGVGLGLALSRGLAEAMSGTLTAENTPGGGLTMVLSLPQAGVNIDMESNPRQEES